MVQTSPRAPESRSLTRAERLLVALYRPVVRRAAREMLEGRRIEPDHVEAGRFLRPDVDRFLERTWAGVEALLPECGLDAMPDLGNTHNGFLGVLTIAAYHALLDEGVGAERAVVLFGDVAWKVYARMLQVPYALAGLTTREPQARMNRTLRLIMWFPFSAPGRPGYEVEAWADDEGMHTHWTWCAPLGVVRGYVARHGDRGEVEAFARSWCTYDWPGADLLAGAGAGERRHYSRPHTLSAGDAVCDMCWTARASDTAPTGTGSP